jgi:molybdenum-dependent DNA-binding transcriptional regulator ModE
MIAKEINIHYRTAKLLYDLLNSFYNIENKIVRGEQGKSETAIEINTSLKELLKEYRVGEAMHIPQEELFVSLKDLRKILHEDVVWKQEDDSDE